MIAIRSGDSGDIPAIIGVMVRGFEDAVLYRYFEPNRAKRSALLELIFTHRIEDNFTKSDVDVALESGRIIGAAVWGKPLLQETAPPAASASSEAAVNTSGEGKTPPAASASSEAASATGEEKTSPISAALEEAVRQYDPAVFERWQHFHEVLFASLDAVCSEPHWSLSPIAVLPEAQGRGVGGALIRHKLPEIDASGAPCLIGTQDEVNVARYGAYGWKLAGRTLIAGDMYSYAMLRRPLV